MRRLFSEWLLLLFFALLFVLSSCKHNPVNPPIENSTLSVVNGKVSNWNYGDSVTVVALTPGVVYANGVYTNYVFGSSHVSSDGSFSINLPIPLPSVLRGYANGHLTFSDPDAKFAAFSGLIIQYPNGSIESQTLQNASVPYSEFISDSAQIGEYRAYYEYADRDVHRVGSDTLWSRFRIIMQDDIQYKKGWNRIVGVIISRTSNSMTIMSSVKNVNEGNWYQQW